MGSTIPFVLIAAPVSERHKHLIDRWLKHLDQLTYPNFEVCLIDTTPKGNKYFNYLKNKKVKGKKITVLKHKWDYREVHVLRMLAHAREDIRQYFLKGSYTHLFWLDDDIFIPKNGLSRLIYNDKDCSGFYVHVFPKGRHKPCIFKDGEVNLRTGLSYFSFKEINEYKRFVKKFKEKRLKPFEKLLVDFIIKDKERPYLFKTHGVNLGCLLIKRHVMEKVPFRTHDKFLFGEDLWFFNEANDKKIELWCDTSCRPRHENTTWDQVLEGSARNMIKYYLAFGPEHAKQGVMVERK